MSYVIFMLLWLSYSNGYHIKSHGPIPLNRENVLKFAENIMQELRQDGRSDDIRPRASQSIYDIFKDMGMNILKIADDDNIDNGPENNYFNRNDDEKLPNKDNNKLSRPHELHSLAKNFIKILIQFDHKPFEQVWDSRPDIKAFTIEDLLGKLDDKNNFLKYLNIAGDIYKSTIDLCEAQQFVKYNRTIPIHLIVTDLVTMAESYNVKILSNKGILFDIYYSGNIIDGSLTVDDLMGGAEDKDFFLKSVNVFSSNLFRDSFNNISTHLYGIPVPDHLNADWVIATAKNLNIVIISNKGKRFNMNWQTRPDSFIGYPPGSYGGMDFVTAVCLNVKKNVNKKIN